MGHDATDRDSRAPRADPNFMLSIDVEYERFVTSPGLEGFQCAKRGSWPFTDRGSFFKYIHHATSLHPRKFESTIK